MAGPGPANKQEFKRALDELIMQAYRNGIPLDNQAFALGHDNSDIPDVEFMIFHLAPSSETE